MIGRLKADGLLGKNSLHGEFGGVYAILCGAGHNLRMSYLRVLGWPPAAAPA